MPPLRGLSCSVRSTSDDCVLPEHAHRYEDGFVETYLEVPAKAAGEGQGGFRIELTSDEYISPGIAMFVYIDGSYQGNRMIDGLGASLDPSCHSTAFRLTMRGHQSIEPDGTSMLRSWKFEGYPLHGQQVAPSVETQATPLICPYDGKYAGTIDVLVKRLYSGDGSSCSSSPFRMPVGGLEYFFGESSVRPKASWGHATNSVLNPWSPFSFTDRVVFPLSNDANSDCFPPRSIPTYNTPGELQFQHPSNSEGKTFLRLGQGILRLDKVVAPKFIDPPGKSFAIFHFKYRDTDTLEAILKMKLSFPQRDMEKDRLARLPKESLIEELLGLKVQQWNDTRPTSKGQSNNPVSNSQWKQGDSTNHVQDITSAKFSLANTSSGSQNDAQKDVSSFYQSDKSQKDKDDSRPEHGRSSGSQRSKSKSSGRSSRKYARGNSKEDSGDKGWANASKPGDTEDQADDWLKNGNSSGTDSSWTVNVEYGPPNSSKRSKDEAQLDKSNDDEGGSSGQSNFVQDAEPRTSAEKGWAKPTEEGEHSDW